MIDRFVGAPLLRRFNRYIFWLCARSSPGLLRISSMVFGGHAAMWAILSVGLFNSIMFATIFTFGAAELGPRRGSGSGLLNMATAGGILPLIRGVVADHIGLHHAFFVFLIRYFYHPIFMHSMDRDQTASATHKFRRQREN